MVTMLKVHLEDLNDYRKAEENIYIVNIIAAMSKENFLQNVEKVN